MSQPPKKRDIEFFFKPQSKSDSPKRPYSALTNDENAAALTSAVPKTPTKSVSFREVTPRSTKSNVLSPFSQSLLPIRSPSLRQTFSPSQNKQTKLFETFKKSPEQNEKVSTSFAFSDVSDRSQRIIKDGKLVGVKDSDDDSDSLPSLDDIFDRRQDAAVTSDSSPPEGTKAKETQGMRIFTHGGSGPIVAREKLRALIAKEKSVKFDLSRMLDDHFGDEESEKSIVEMREGFRDAHETASDDQHQRRLLAAVVQTSDADQEDVARLLSAVERTEALSAELGFSFFRSDFDAKKPKGQVKSFPRSAVPDQLWLPEDQEGQNRAFLSGHMSSLAQAGTLDDEALRWTFCQIIREPRPDLRRAYLDCLKAGSKAWTRINLTATEVQSAFLVLGTSPDCLGEATWVETKPILQRQNLTQALNYLLSAILVFTEICMDMELPALSVLSSTVLRITLDRLVMSDSRMCIAVENLIESLLSIPDQEARNHVYDRFVSDAIEHLGDSQLQSQLLAHISPTTPLALKLRKTLADAFLLGKCIVSKQTMTSNVTLRELTEHISTSDSFSITRHANTSAIDYSVLTALTRLLDIAVTSNDATHCAGTSESSESVFNNSVDALADQIHAVFVSIKDSGASHMRRTEAKDALHALYFRLLYSVRSRPRKKKHVFDSNGEMRGGSWKNRWVTGEEWREKERGTEFMKKYLVRKETAQ